MVVISVIVFASSNGVFNLRLPAGFVVFVIAVDLVGRFTAGFDVFVFTAALAGLFSAGFLVVVTSDALMGNTKAVS